jgi:hypothetical protein
MIDIHFPGERATDGVGELFSRALNLNVGSEIMKRLEGERTIIITMQLT